jgi:hypothetical protein
MRFGRAALALACALGLPRGAHAGPRQTDETSEPTDPPEPAAPTAALAASARARAARPRTYPLVLLVQADAVLSSEADAANAAARTGADAPDGSALRLRRLRLGEDVRAGAWRARLTLEATSRAQRLARLEGGRIPVGGTIRLTEAFVAWAPHRALQLSVGAQRVPFSLSRLVDEADLRLAERPQIVTALAPDYLVGVAVRSDLGLLDLRAAFFAADAILDGRLFSAGYLGVLRLSADPIGPMGVAPWRRRADDPWASWWRFSAGVSLMYGSLLQGNDALAIEGDAQLQWRRVTVTAEYLGEHVNASANPEVPTPPQGPLHWPHQGAVVEPGVFLIPERVELVLRGAWYRRPLDITVEPNDTTDTLAGGAGLTVFAHAAQVRLQAAFELRRTLQSALPDSSWAIFRATFAL